MLFDLHHPPGPGQALLAQMTGRAELAVTGTSARDAIALVDACLETLPGTVLAPGRAAEMSVSDRDRLMAALYRAIFGDRITGNALCARCDERFDFDFALGDLLGALSPSRDAPDDEGWYHEGTVRFRVPTGVDELAAAGQGAARAADIIALRCAPDARDDDQRSAVEARMAEVAPLIDLTLNATCPDCDHSNPMAFRAERYLLTTLLNQRHAVLRDVHLLAAQYRWSFAEITGLPRDTRQALVAQVLRDNSARAKAVTR
jgi:hypothetical protein